MVPRSIRIRIRFVQIWLFRIWARDPADEKISCWPFLKAILEAETSAKLFCMRNLRYYIICSFEHAILSPNIYLNNNYHVTGMRNAISLRLKSFKQLIIVLENTLVLYSVRKNRRRLPNLKKSDPRADYISLVRIRAFGVVRFRISAQDRTD